MTESAPSVAELRRIAQQIDDGHMDPSDPRAWLSQSDAAKVARVSRYTLARYGKAGRLAVSKRSPKTWLVYVPSLLALLPSPSTIHDVEA